MCLQFLRLLGFSSSFHHHALLSLGSVRSGRSEIDVLSCC